MQNLKSFRFDFRESVLTNLTIYKMLNYEQQLHRSILAKEKLRRKRAKKQTKSKGVCCKLGWFKKRLTDKKCLEQKNSISNGTKTTESEYSQRKSSTTKKIKISSASGAKRGAIKIKIKHVNQAGTDIKPIKKSL